MSSSFLTSVFEPVYAVPANQNTTDAFADVTGSKIDTFSKTKVCYTCKNVAVGNSIDWKVLCSNDDTTYIEAQASATLIPNAVGSYTNTLATYRYYKVQIKATVGGAHGTSNIVGYSKV